MSRMALSLLFSLSDSKACNSKHRGTCPCSSFLFLRSRIFQSVLDDVGCPSMNWIPWHHTCKHIACVMCAGWDLGKRLRHICQTSYASLVKLAVPHVSNCIWLLLSSWCRDLSSTGWYPGCPGREPVTCLPCCVWVCVRACERCSERVRESNSYVSSNIKDVGVGLFFRPLSLNVYAHGKMTSMGGLWSTPFLGVRLVRLPLSLNVYAHM